MTYTLVIVESPAKCGKIEGFLGPGYKCMASYGHIQQLSNLKNIDMENNFKPTFEYIDAKKMQITKLRKAITESNNVMLATDDDREGEAIAWHICEVFNLSIHHTPRIIFHEITKDAIVRAVNSPTTLNMHIVHAQQSRQILDLIVGYKISPLLWKHISRNSKKGLSAGRCQTPALRLIYDNQKDIDQSPGKKAYNTTGYFTKLNIPFVLNYHHEEKMETFLEESVNFEHKFSCSKPKNTTKKPPIPFTTSTLQQKASNEMNISPKETMAISQKLYEGGYITYMRTDSTTYSKEFLEKTKVYITDKYDNKYVNENIDQLSERKVEKKTTKKKKKGEGKAFAVTTPLIEKADGGKFGKTESGNIWLDKTKTSPYKFYQFWLNSSDKDAENYIKIFTLKNHLEIKTLIAEHNKTPHLRLLQKAIAEEVTKRVHSKKDLEMSIKASNILFGKSTASDLKSLDEDTFLAVFEGVPQFEMRTSDLKLGILDVLAEKTQIFKSKGEARRMISANAVNINKEKITEHFKLSKNNLLSKRYLVVQKGKKNYFLIIVK